jgi:hypothetical protein
MIAERLCAVGSLFNTFAAYRSCGFIYVYVSPFLLMPVCLAQQSLAVEGTLNTQEKFVKKRYMLSCLCRQNECDTNLEYNPETSSV